MKYVKQSQLCFKSGINYNDLENEINRLQIGHQSAEEKQKLAQEKLDNLLETNGWDKAEFEGIWRDVQKSSRRLRYLASLLHNCQMMKDGIIPLPKARTDRAWRITQSSTCTWKTNTERGKKWVKMPGKNVWKNE